MREEPTQDIDRAQAHSGARERLLPPVELRAPPRLLPQRQDGNLNVDARPPRARAVALIDRHAERRLAGALPRRRPEALPNADEVARRKGAL